jgi:hypothetical protein
MSSRFATMAGVISGCAIASVVFNRPLARTSPKPSVRLMGSEEIEARAGAALTA